MAITTSPTYPAEGVAVTVGSTVNTGAVAQHIVLELTSVPAQSALATGFVLTDDTDADAYTSAVEVAEAGLDTAVVTLDVGGEYGLTIYGVWALPPASLTTGADDGQTAMRYRLKFRDAVTLDVGAFVELPVVTTAGDGASLRLQVNDATIRAATLVDPSTERARIAALQTAVLAALAALVGQTVAAVGTDLQTGVNDLLANYEAHRILVGAPPACHLVADATNVAATTAANSQAGAIQLLNRLRAVVLAHAQVSPAGFVGAWHQVDDLLNTPLAAPAGDLGTATVLSADLRERVYERHRVQAAAPAVHIGADATNDLAAPSLLDTAIVAYLDALAILDPTAPAGESEGAQDAAHRYGFARVS